MKTDLSASWAIAKKDMRIYYIKPGTLMFGVLFPLFMFLSFAVGKNEIGRASCRERVFE